MRLIADLRKIRGGRRGRGIQAEPILRRALMSLERRGTRWISSSSNAAFNRGGC